MIALLLALVVVDAVENRDGGKTATEKIPRVGRLFRGDASHTRRENYRANGFFFSRLVCSTRVVLVVRVVPHAVGLLVLLRDGVFSGRCGLAGAICAFIHRRSRKM